MNSSTRQPAQRAAAGVLAGALALSLAAVTAVPAGAALGFKLERVAGPDRYATSAAVADRFGGAAGALLASGEAGRYADALSANFLAGVRNVPVLLTQKDTTPAVVLAALGRAGARDITLVGGTDVISAAQETALRDAGFTVTRLGGADRFATSREVVAAGQASAAPVGLVATGLDFADALGAGPLSYQGKHPMFLVRRDSVPTETLTAMRAAGTTSVIIVGGEAVVGPAVVDALRGAGITVVTRLAGSDRSATSVEVADYLLAAGYDRTAFNLASGQNGGVDALGGAALSGRQNRALLITNTASNAGAVMGFAEVNRATLTGTGLVFGGPAAVSDDVVRALETTGGMGQSNQTFSVTPNTAAMLPLVGTEDGSAAADSDNRAYSVATPAAGAVHQIRLVPASSVTVDGNGVVRFADADGTPAGAGDNLADFGSIDARIVNVNSVDVAATAATTAIPVGGTITFEIEGNSAESVVPVVFFDADVDGNLDLNVDNTPAAAEVFGVGGVTTFFNRAASTGDAAGAVGSVNKGANQFDANDRTFTYDANDVFRIGTAQVTLDEFEAALSAGDSVAAIDYQANPALVSTFTLTNTNPGTAPNPTASVANSNDVTVTVDLGTTANVDSVVIQRATVTGGTAGAFATIATEAATDDVTGTAGVQVVYVDNDVPAGTYQYRALLVNDGDSGDASATPVQVVTTTPAPADTTAPTIADARVATNNGSAFLLEAGDSFLLAFSEAVAAPTAGDTFRVTDADGTVVDVLASGATQNTTDVTINGTVYGASRVLTVTRSNSDVFVVSGTQADLGLPATITAQAGTVDAAGNQVNLAGSADVVIDTEAGTVVVAPAPADTTAPTLNAAAAVADNGAGNDTAVLTFSESVVAVGGTYTNSQFFYDADCDGGLDRIFGVVAQTGANSVTLTLAHGTIPAVDDPNDCIGYLDDNAAAADDGDVVDAAGNPLATNSSATVPAKV